MESIGSSLGNERGPDIWPGLDIKHLIHDTKNPKIQNGVKFFLNAVF